MGEKKGQPKKGGGKGGMAEGGYRKRVVAGEGGGKRERSRTAGSRYLENPVP